MTVFIILWNPIQKVSICTHSPAACFLSLAHISLLSAWIPALSTISWGRLHHTVRLVKSSWISGRHRNKWTCCAAPSLCLARPYRWRGAGGGEWRSVTVLWAARRWPLSLALHVSLCPISALQGSSLCAEGCFLQTVCTSSICAEEARQHRSLSLFNSSLQTRGSW